jgi:type IV pilus assembly protein PilN
MIRINLLGVAKPKKGKRTSVAVPEMAGEGPSILIVLLLVAAVTAGANYWWYTQLNKKHEKIQSGIQAVDYESARLIQVKAAFTEKQKQADQYKRRFDVIDQLKSRQDGPVKLLGMIGNTVNSTDAVWLQSMTDEGATIQLQGVALSQVAVASLMTNLKQSGYFKSVEIKETAQEDVVKNMQAFSFTLICEKQKV